MNTVRLAAFKVSLLSLALSTVVLAQESVDLNRPNNGNTISIDLPLSTQGAIWPPAEVADENGDFILLGQSLRKNAEGVVEVIPSQNQLISKNSIPPQDENGVLVLNDPFSAEYTVVRELDLSEGSSDLDMVLFTQSFGPWDTPSGAPRIPGLGDSAHNLNTDGVVCPEIAPTLSQLASNFYRPQYPLHETPVHGFQGDNVRYNADTWAPEDPQTATGCSDDISVACPGEDALDSDRRSTPITLGEWIKARGRLTVSLTDWDKEQGAYTAANFNYKLRNLLPNSIYTTWAVRPRLLAETRRPIDPVATPNVIMADSRGNADVTFKVENPFPDPATDVFGKRIVGLSVVYHSDLQNWGACFTRFGPGVDIHVLFNTLSDGTFDFAPNFITKSKTN